MKLCVKLMSWIVNSPGMLGTTKIEAWRVNHLEETHSDRKINYPANYLISKSLFRVPGNEIPRHHTPPRRAGHFLLLPRPYGAARSQTPRWEAHAATGCYAGEVAAGRGGGGSGA